MTLKGDSVTGNHANAGDGGQGVGGGVYNLGDFSFDVATFIVGNHAITSNNAIYG